MKSVASPTVTAPSPKKRKISAGYVWSQTRPLVHWHSHASAQDTVISAVLPDGNSSQLAPSNFPVEAVTECCRREYACDFCNSTLPDWRDALALHSTINAPAIMNVNFEGKTYSFEVKPGTSGYAQFTEAIRHAFQLPIDSELNITFTCDEPCNDEGTQYLSTGRGVM